MFLQRWLAILTAALSIPALAAPAPEWRLTRDEHFEIYAQSSDQRARAILTWFEQLRAFFEQQGGSKTIASTPVRVLVFASEPEYEPYRLHSIADAYFVGSGNQNYIVMGTDDPGRFRLAAHEYAHLVLRDSHLQLPPWLKEGLPEFFATLRITDHTTELGGALPGRVRTLQTRAWMPLADVLSLTEEARDREERKTAELFYSESWALTEMLLLSPGYAPGFQKFLALAEAGSPSLEAIRTTYAKSDEDLTRDLHAWLAQRVLPSMHLPQVVTGALPVDVAAVSPLAARLVLAQLLLAAGEFDRADALFSALVRDAPDSADVSTALGMIALHKGDTTGARRAWKRAIDQGVTDAMLCYRYAALADQAGLSPDDIRPALERAIALQPDFDDAHYQLALLDKNAGRYEAALEQFHAMRVVPETRAFAYWLGLADTFNELGRREQAQAAAGHAGEHATRAEERARAAQQSYIAQTDPGVQFARGPNGQLQMVTTRMPHQTSDWNPFIEPSDDIRRVQGALREIDCSGAITVRVEAAGKVVVLTIPDLKHVQMRHAPAEFTCGPQDPAAQVIVDYTAAGGVVRGMDFQ